MMCSRAFLALAAPLGAWLLPALLLPDVSVAASVPQLDAVDNVVHNITGLISHSVEDELNPEYAYEDLHLSNHELAKRAGGASSLPALGDAWDGETTTKVIGKLGIGAMQAIVTEDDEMLVRRDRVAADTTPKGVDKHISLTFFRLKWTRYIVESPSDLDKSQNNALMYQGHSAWGLVLNTDTLKQKALPMVSNSFCAGGSFISNGNVVSVGGQPDENTELGHRGIAVNGYTSLRVYQPGSYTIMDDLKKAHIQSKRWYGSVVRIADGSVIVFGGAKLGQYNNNATADNPTIEFWPTKGPELYSKFLHDALNSNLFPLAFELSHSGFIFVVANELAMIYDWGKNVEHRVAGPPGGIVRTYPGSAAAVILPLTKANNWASEILICGGVPNSVDMRYPGLKVSANGPVSKQCARTTVSGTKIRGWTTEMMPMPRVMADAVLTPDGKVLLVGGAQTGTAGYGNAYDMVGHSNANHPAYQPVLYDPTARQGRRFSANFPKASVERLYHSTTMLLPSGEIFSMGSSPNPRVLSKNVFRTRFEIEKISPPYMRKQRPSIVTFPKKIGYNGKFTLTIKNPQKCGGIRVILHEGGYATHGVHMNQRWVEMRVESVKGNTVTFLGPQDETIWPPGPAWVWVLGCKGNIPSTGHKLMVGGGKNPPGWKLRL